MKVGKGWSGVYWVEGVYWRGSIIVHSIYGEKEEYWAVGGEFLCCCAYGGCGGGVCV